MAESPVAMTLVRRPRPLPWKMRRLARETGKDPRATVVAVLTTAWSYEEAAVELGITPKTLRNWRRILGIEVTNDHAQRADAGLHALLGNGRTRTAGSNRTGPQGEDVVAPSLRDMRGNGKARSGRATEEVPA